MSMIDTMAPTELEPNDKRHFSGDLTDVAMLARNASLPPQSAAFLRSLVHFLHNQNSELSARALINALPTDLRQLDTTDLRATLVRLGYPTRVLYTKLRDLKPHHFPCLFLDEKDRLYSVTYEGEGLYRLYSGQVDQARLFRKPNLQGKAWAPATAQENDENENSKTRNIWSLSGLWQRFHSPFSALLLLSVLIQTVGLSFPLLTILVYDRVAGAGGDSDVLTLGAGFILAMAFEWGLRWQRARIVSWCAARLELLTGETSFARLLHLPTSYIEQAPLSSQISRLKSFEALRDMLGSPLFINLFDLPLLGMLAVGLFFFVGNLALIPLGAIAVFFGIFWMRHNRMRDVMQKSAAVQSKKQDLILETLDQIGPIYSQGLRGLWQQRAQAVSAQAAQTNRHMAMAHHTLEYSVQAIVTIAGMLTLIFGTYHVLEHNLSTGVLIATMMIVWRILSPFGMMCTAMPRFEQVAHTLSQLQKLMMLPVETDPETIEKSALSFRGDIKFQNVGLRYNRDRDPLFVNLNLNVKAGQLIAVCGVNGAGKSSILKLCADMMRPQAGSIHFDGMDIRQFDPTVLRQAISYVPQAPDLFDGSIADNLRLANPLASDAELKEALLAVDAWEEVSNLPEQMTTQVGYHGAWLISDSLAYQINLARACLRPKSIVLCDEIPHEFLAGRGALTFMRLLNSWKGERTVVFVSHRDDHLRLASQALWLRGSGVPVVTTPEKLIEALKQEKRRTMERGSNV